MGESFKKFIEHLHFLFPFFFKRQWVRQTQTPGKSSCPLTDSFPMGPQWLGLGLKPEAGNSVQVSHFGDRSPITLSHSCQHPQDLCWQAARVWSQSQNQAVNPDMPNVGYIQLVTKHLTLHCLLILFFPMFSEIS